MSSTFLQLPSFAKINWSLRVLGRREDGYHEIDTVLQTVSLHDDLTFLLRQDGRIVLNSDAADIPKDNSNLIVKAAEALQNSAKVDLGAEIQLTKRIPPQGGLGGASSNAATTLLALNHLWQTRHGVDQLRAIGGQLGSDVPFFFTGGTARATGTGSTISTMPDSVKRHLLVITPNAKVSTASAYRALRAPSLTTTGSASILSSSFREPISADYDQWALSNDFEGVIFEIEPEIRRVKEALLDAGAQGGLLAGSGSSVFGIFEHEQARARALVDLKLEEGWRVFSCETISRNEYENLRSTGFPQSSSL